MDFVDPDRTPFDLRFRIGAIPVLVTPWFWVISAALGWSNLHRGFRFLAAWIACVFVSVLVHELGHVVVGKWFGSHGWILLQGFGGLAVNSNALRKHWQRIAVSMAGPGAGFLLYGAAWALVWNLDLGNLDPIVLAIFSNLLWINLAWGILNLLPIWPLDGGQITRDFLDWLTPRNGIRISLVISLVVSALLALNCFLATQGKAFLPFFEKGDDMLALFFALFAFQSFQLLQEHSRRIERDPWKSESEFEGPDPEAWKR